MSIIKVQVTKEHIEQGKPYDSYACPIALALLSHGSKAYVGGFNIAFVDHKTGYRVFGHLPNVAQTFAWHFDHEQSVQPFEFEMEVE